MASPTPYAPPEAAFENPVLLLSGAVAGQDLSALQWTFVKIDPTNQTIVPCVAGDSAVGVLQDKPTNQQGAGVMVLGVSKCVAGGALNAGSYVTTDASGRAVPISANGTAQADTVAVNTLTASHVYTITVNGIAFTYTAAASGETQQNILTQLSNSITATQPLTGAVTGTGTSAVLTLTSTVPGDVVDYTAVDAQLTRTNTVVAVRATGAASINGMAIQSASAVGDIIPVLIR